MLLSRKKVLTHLINLYVHFQHQIFAHLLHVFNPVSREGGFRQIHITKALT